VDIGIDQVWISPNKLWIAVLSGLSVKIAPNDKLQTSGELELRTILEVINSTSTQKWLVEDIPAESFMSYEEAWPLAWSHDGQYLYFTHRLDGGDGCFTAAEFYGTDLLKISLTDGHVSEIVPRVGDWVALSPDEAQFAYLSRDQSLGKQWLVMRDLATGDERRRPVDELNEYDISWATDLIWSPDGTTLVYTLKINVCGSPEDESTSIVAVNANSLEQKTLIREDKRWLQSIQWLSNGKVLLRDGSNESWWLNPDTGELIKAKS
jgi:Tol biopolymer transport system component